MIKLLPIILAVITFYVAPKLEAKFETKEVPKYEKAEVATESAKPVLHQPQRPPTVVRQTIPSSIGSDVVSIIMEVFGSDGRIAVAIASAESGLRCDAKGDGNLNPSSYGVFQIRAFSSRPPIEKLLDCRENIKEAKRIYDSQGWYPWSVFTNGKYLSYL